MLDANFGASIRAGDRLLNIPKQAASLQISRETQFAQRPLSYGLGYQHVGERLGETATGFTLPAYNLARLFTRYAISDALALRLEVNNLFDETYYTNSFSALWVQPGTPRSARCTIRRAKKNLALRGFNMAEGQGFEPWELLHSTVFKTAALGHSATPPNQASII